MTTRVYSSQPYMTLGKELGFGGRKRKKPKPKPLPLGCEQEVKSSIWTLKMRTIRFG